MAVKVYGILASTCTKLVLQTCIELGVEYELLIIELFKGEQYNPEWISNKNPFAAVPDEDGTQIFECRAIARYLVLKYGPQSGLLPPTSDLKATALFEQAASIEYSSFSPPAIAIYGEYLFARQVVATGLKCRHKFIPMRRMNRLEGREVNQELVEKNKAQLLKKFEGYERILSKQKYLAGEIVTLADLFHIPFGKTLEALKMDIFESQPSVKRWWDDITSRESSKAIAALK